MAVRSRRVLLGGLTAVLLALTACGESTPTATSTTVIEPTTTTTVATVTTGPVALPGSGFLEPGEDYVTTLFEPTVMYRVERDLLLSPFQNAISTGLQNHRLIGASVAPEEKQGLAPYRGVTIHNAWRRFSIEEAMSELAAIETLALGPATDVVIGGFTGIQMDGVVNGVNLIYVVIPAVNCNRAYCPWLEIGPMRFIVLDTTAGTLLITIDAGEDEFDQFLLVAEEILAGISFPDLER